MSRWRTFRVDIETGLVKLNRFVAVQDCGLVDQSAGWPKARCYGACIMGIVHGSGRRARDG